MAQFVVRNIDDSTKAKLQRRAARHGRSMEEEVRDILRDAVKDEARPPRDLGTRIAERFKGCGLRDDEMIGEVRGSTIRSPFDP